MNARKRRKREKLRKLAIAKKEMRKYFEVLRTEIHALGCSIQFCEKRILLLKEERKARIRRYILQCKERGLWKRERNVTKTEKVVGNGQGREASSEAWCNETGELSE